ncbi:MAG: DALR anticodon-binding domain-containing protein, partial [Pseudomonadota bacterium]
SKRAGTFVTLADVVDEVGPDVARFIMLMRKNDAQLDFDVDKVTEQSKDNPVWYVQYAHARIRSVLRKGAQAGMTPDLDALAVLTHEAELELAAKMAAWPRIVEIAAAAHEPHRIAFYLYDLASDLHAHWNKGNAEPELRFLQEGDQATSAGKLALAQAVSIVISAGLGILGITPAEEL